MTYAKSRTRVYRNDVNDIAHRAYPPQRKGSERQSGVRMSLAFCVMPMFPNLNPRAYCQKCHVLIPEGEEVVAEREEGQHWKVWHVGMCPSEAAAHAAMLSIADSLTKIAQLVELSVWGDGSNV